MSYSAKDDARLQELLDVIVDASGDLAVATHCNAETEIRPARKLIWEQVDALFSHVDGLVNTRPREDALQAEVEMLREALTEVTELLSFEINPANYDEDDVSRLNGNSIGAWQVATAALKGDAQ